MLINFGHDMSELDIFFLSDGLKGVSMRLCHENRGLICLCVQRRSRSACTSPQSDLGATLPTVKSKNQLIYSKVDSVAPDQVA